MYGLSGFFLDKMKLFYKIVGTLSLALGLLGIVLPVLPTTPFLLLTAALYARSSDKLYAWLMNHPRLGAYIKDFREHRSLPLHVKVVSIAMLWATILLSVYLVKVTWLRVLLLVIALGVTVHILHYKTRK